jgi:hypothetical protein
VSIAFPLPLDIGCKDCDLFFLNSDVILFGPQGLCVHFYEKKCNASTNE